MKANATTATPPRDRSGVSVRLATTEADVQCFDAQLAARHSLGAGTPVRDYLRQVVELAG